MKHILFKKLWLTALVALLAMSANAQRSAEAKWALTSTETTTVQTKGLITNAEMTFTERLKVNAYSGPEATIIMQYVDGNLPASEQADAYIQFAVTADATDAFSLQEISGYFCGKGGGNMRANFYYSTDPSFTTKTKIPYQENADLQRDVYDSKMTETISDLEITAGSTLYFRIYPFYKQASNGKYLCMKDVTIKGYTPGEPIYEVPTLAPTQAASYISTTFASTASEILGDGDATITEYGFVYDTATEPTVELSSKFVGDNINDDKFTAKIEGLTPNTTYYVRSYATNSQGTAYGDEMTFTTLAELVAPTVVTGTSTSITNAGFGVNNCDVTAWGGSTVTEKGIVYSTSENPTITDAKSVRGSDIGKYNAGVGNLAATTKYYVRAFATNATGTAYGAQIEVTTVATQPNIEMTVAQDGSGDYTTIQAAFNATQTNYNGKQIIYVKPGIYEERLTLAANKNNVYLLGCEDEVENTVIKGEIAAGMSNGAGGTWGTSNSQIVSILGNDFTCANITIQNTFVNKKTGITGLVDASGTQAVALKTQGDRQAFYNCRILGYQDTYLGNSVGRAYFKDCYIEGNVDFIFGSQTCVFDNCTTYVNRNGSVITAPATKAETLYGMVFLDCELTAPEQGTMDFDGVAFASGEGKGFYFGRPWKDNPKSAFIRCNAPASLELKGWTTMNGGLNPVFLEFGTTGAGGVNTSQRANEGVVIPDASEFTVSNIFKAATDPSFLYDWMPAANADESFDCSLSGLSKINCNKSFLKSTLIENQLELLNASEIAKIEIIDLTGKKVQTTEVKSEIIPFRTATQGMYIVKGFTKNGEMLTAKIMKH